MPERKSRSDWHYIQRKLSMLTLCAVITQMGYLVCFHDSTSFSQGAVQSTERNPFFFSSKLQLYQLLLTSQLVVFFSDEILFLQMYFRYHHFHKVLLTISSFLCCVSLEGTFVVALPLPLWSNRYLVKLYFKRSLHNPHTHKLSIPLTTIQYVRV